MSHAEPDLPTEVDNYLDWSDKGRAGIARYLVGLVLILVVFFLLGQVLSLPVAVAYPDHEDSLIQSTVILLLSFVIPFFAIPALTHWVHQRPSWSVAMPRRELRGWDFGVGFGVSAVVGLATVAGAALVGAIDLEWGGMDWSRWLPLLAIGLVGLLIQTGAEEMLFRGYLTQLMRRLTSHPAVFLAVPALVFAAPHISNVKSLGGGPLVMLPYFATGLLYGWAAYRSGSLYLSWGLHFNNNLFNLLVVGASDDILKSVAPLQFPGPDLLVTTVIIVVQCALTLAVLLPLIRRREAAGSLRVSEVAHGHA
ncbi:CPBP family intramembrane glutamic endopeptidase [Nocardioides taihuensis]|uniref:CPBP family intramembrane glutamic endopeptidase n=1 Tax=Nocardioides taihuensis TaxID=1835606 RepID=A0ABW0BP29_9ACTN